MKWKKMNLQLFADAHEQLQNTTGSSGMSAEMKTFYERRLIDQALPALVHDQFGDSYPIPANNGKTIEFRKYDALPKATTPLTEGVTPEGQALTVTTVTAEVHQYGGWVPLTDMVQMTTIDNNVVQATSVLASQSGRTMDTIVRDILAGGTNVIYATTELEGGGLQHIVKQLGYGDDPLNQRASVGWKAVKTAERLSEQYMVRIESCSARYSAKAKAN